MCGRANKRVLKDADVRACDTFLDGTDERFVCRVAREQALRGGGEGKGEDLIGQFLTAQQQRSHREFLGRTSNLWDVSASSPSPFPSPAPASPKELARKRYAGPRMP